MERLIRYFDRVKAEEDLKEKTKSFIRETIVANDDGDLSRIYQARKSQAMFRKFVVAAAPIAACFALAIGGYGLYKTPVDYVSYDINPSLELGLNYFGRVVDSEGFNSDGRRILAECRIEGLTAEEAVKTLTLQANEDGYIKNDGSTVIAVTAESKRTQDSARLENQLAQEMQNVIDENGLNAVVYTDCTDLQIRTEARQYGLSPGKYKLILMLGSLDPNVDTEQYRNVRITDILLKADELMRQNVNSQLDEEDWNINEIRNVALKIESAYQENEKNRNQNGMQSVSSSAIGTEKEQEQNQSQQKTQSGNPTSTNQSQLHNGQQSTSTSSPAIEQEQMTVQNQNQGDSQAAAEQELTQNQNQNGSGGTDASDNGQSSQNQSDGGQGSSPADSNKPK